VSLEEKVNSLLAERGLTLAVAESCTGGLVSSRITDVAGASKYFEAGFVTYSNRAKAELLHIPAVLVEAKGAVSHEVAQKMAEGVRKAARVDIGLSVTGIAGPSGGSPEKPVGTVFMALAIEGRTIARRHDFSGDRLAIKKQTADEALRLLLDYLEGSME
jgi:PncC family amidohydrolase